MSAMQTTSRSSLVLLLSIPQSLHLLARFKQRFQRPLRLDLAVFQHDDVICSLKYASPVRDDQAGALLNGEDALPECLFRHHVERAGKVVEDKQIGVASQHARCGGAPRLPA